MDWDEDNYYATPDYDDTEYEFKGKTAFQLEEEKKAQMIKDEEQRILRIKMKIEYEKMLLGYNLKRRDKEYKREYDRYCARLASSY